MPQPLEQYQASNASRRKEGGDKKEHTRLERRCSTKSVEGSKVNVVGALQPIILHDSVADRDVSLRSPKARLSPGPGRV